VFVFGESFFDYLRRVLHGWVDGTGAAVGELGGIIRRDTKRSMEDTSDE